MNDLQSDERPSLSDLRRASRDAIKKLPEHLSDEWFAGDSHATRRADRLNILPLLYEFQDSFDHTPFLHYELAFEQQWLNPDHDARLYASRKWISNYDAGVYFIYDQTELVCHIGSGCGGSLGRYLQHERHRSYRCFIDVVLFDHGWLHLAQAWEILAISRLQALHNNRGKRVWIPPPAPFDRIWKPTRLLECSAAVDAPEERASDGIG